MYLLYVQKKNFFLGATKFGEAPKIWGYCPRNLAVATGLKCRLPNRISFDVFDRCFCKVATRACETLRICAKRLGASRWRLCPGPRVTRLDGARGKKQVWRSLFETEVVRKQMRCIEKSTCDIVGTFRHPSLPLGAPRSDWRPGNNGPLAPLVTLLRQLPPKVGKLRVRAAEDYRKKWLIEFARLTKPDSACVVYPFFKLCKINLQTAKLFSSAIMGRTPNEMKMQFKVSEGWILQWLLNLLLPKVRNSKLSNFSMMHRSTATVDHVRLKGDSKKHGVCSIEFSFLLQINLVYIWYIFGQDLVYQL